MTPTTIKIGETDITFSDTITKDGTGFDASGCDVAFWLRNVLGGTSFSGSGAVTGGSGSGVTFTADADFAAFLTSAGKYYQEWSITTSDMVPLTFSFPEDGYNQIRVLDKLA